MVVNTHQSLLLPTFYKNIQWLQQIVKIPNYTTVWLSNFNVWFVYQLEQIIPTQNDAECRLISLVMCVVFVHFMPILVHSPLIS